MYLASKENQWESPTDRTFTIKKDIAHSEQSRRDSRKAEWIDKLKQSNFKG